MEIMEIGEVAVTAAGAVAVAGAAAVIPDNRKPRTENRES
jgi:hypothetical protein